MALVWSAVTTRGLEITLPLPSASSAEISRFRKRAAPELKIETANAAGLKSLLPKVGAGKLYMVVLLLPKPMRMVSPSTDPNLAPALFAFTPLMPKRTPNDRPHVSDASTIRASIMTCRIGMSSLATMAATCSSTEGTSVTNSMLVRASAMAEPRLLSILALWLPPSPLRLLTKSTALA